MIVLSGSGGNFSTGIDLAVFMDMGKLAALETCESRKREGSCVL